MMITAGSGRFQSTPGSVVTTLVSLSDKQLLCMESQKSDKL